MMLSELSLLLEAAPEGASPDDYREAVLQENVLLKKSAANRKKSLKHLRELYVLDSREPLLAALRRFWEHDPASLPLLALLTAAFRDELLRATVPLVLETPAGERLEAERFSEALAAAFPDRMSATTLRAAGQRAASSWTQSGHLEGRYVKTRAKPTITPGAVAHALFLGHLAGVRGLLLYETLWARILDVPANELDALAFSASRKTMLEYRRVGEVAEFGFSALGEAGRV